MLLLAILINFPIDANGSDGNKKEGKWVIVIDPGHGGRDPGAIGSFSKEKDITLAVAKKTSQYLRENLGEVNVILTRNDDSTLDLKERPKIANRNNADLFISIHSNWAKSKSVTGAETFIMGLASSDENLEVAMKENEVILLEDDHSTNYQGFDPKSPESYIIFTLTQNVYQEQSTALAMKVQNQFTEKAGRKDRGVKQAGFWVLYNTSMPAILVETGFITNLSEEKFLNSEQGQDYLASAIFRACREYMNEVDMRSGIKLEPEVNGSKQDITFSGTGTYFTVQILTASTSSEIKPDNFKGLKDIAEINTGERFRYVSGKFEVYSDAVKHRKKLETLYPDAFVIAVRDNKILPLQQALEQRRKK